MRKKSLKCFIIACLLSLTLTSIPNFTASAAIKDEATFDLTSVDNQSAGIITQLKESEHTFYYEESSDSITFYIKEPEHVEIDNFPPSEDSLQSFTTMASGIHGTNKIVWKPGVLNFDLYLSATSKTNISQMSTSAAYTYLTTFLPGGKVLLQLAAGALGGLLTAPTYSSGSVYVFRNGSYKYNYLQ